LVSVCLLTSSDKCVVYFIFLNYHWYLPSTQYSHKDYSWTKNLFLQFFIWHVNCLSFRIPYRDWGQKITHSFPQEKFKWSTQICVLCRCMFRSIKRLLNIEEKWKEAKNKKIKIRKNIWTNISCIYYPCREVSSRHFFFHQ
jgi:hypothetical protein